MVQYVPILEANGSDLYQWVQVDLSIGWIEQIVADVLGSFYYSLEVPYLAGKVEWPNTFEAATGDLRAHVNISFDGGSRLLTVGHQYKARLSGAVEVLFVAALGTGDKPILDIVDPLVNYYRFRTVNLCGFEAPSVLYKRTLFDRYEVMLRFPFSSTKALGRIVRPTYTAGLASQSEVEYTLRNRFGLLFEDATGLPVVYDNENENAPSGSAWARFRVRAPSFDIEEPGPRAYRLRGQAVVDLFVPTGTGIQYSAQLADIALEVMRTVSDNSTTLRLPAPVFAGRRGAWWQTTLICPFYADEVV